VGGWLSGELRVAGCVLRVFKGALPFRGLLRRLAPSRNDEGAGCGLRVARWVVGGRWWVVRGEEWGAGEWLSGDVRGGWLVVGGGWWVVRGEEWGVGEWLSGELRVAGCAQGRFCWLALSGDDVTVGMVFVVAAVGVYLPAAWGRFYTELKTRSGSVSGSVCLFFLCSVNATPI